MNWHIAPISAHPDCVDTLARWHHDEWGALMAPWSLADARAELVEHVHSAGFPMTWVAHDDQGRLAGSISLVATDAPDFPEYSPWLASLYVAPEFRGQGLGSALIAELMAGAARLGFQRLYLFAPRSPAIYERAGWKYLATRKLGERVVILMQGSPFVTADP